jgi:glycosyltransferase involved in cell wall biosynthesis
LRILQLIQKQQLRGAEIFAAQLSEQLSAQGHEVLLVSVFEGGASLPFSGEHVCLKANSSKRLWDWSAWKNLATMIEQFKPDVVQANSGDTLKYASSSRFFFKWRARLIFRNANLISGFVTSKLSLFYNQLLLRQVDGVASVSVLCSRDFIQTFSFPRGKVAVLPVGVLPIDRALDLPEDLVVLLKSSPFLIHIGSFAPEKNHADLLYIFDQLRDKNPELKLVLVGEGPLKQMYEAQLCDRDDVIFAGSRPDVNRILPFATALLLPSLIEGLPGVILEAMNNFVPVVSYDVGGISEVVIAGDTGWLVDRGERDLMVSAVQEVLDMGEEERQSIIKRAKQLVTNRYQVESLAAKFETFYKEIIVGPL